MPFERITALSNQTFTLFSNCYTMVCPPVRGDNPRALGGGLSPVQADKPWLNYFYTILISIDLAQYEIFSGKVCDIWSGKGVITTIKFILSVPIFGLYGM